MLGRLGDFFIEIRRFGRLHGKKVCFWIGMYAIMKKTGRERRGRMKRKKECKSCKSGRWGWRCWQCWVSLIGLAVCVGIGIFLAVGG